MGINRQPADPKLRRAALRYLLIAAVAGAFLIGLYRSLLAWSVTDASLSVARMAVIIGTLYIPALPALWMCRRLWSLGRAVTAGRRFPPAGVGVIRATPVVTGRGAALRGVMLRAVALTAAITFVVTPLVLWWLLYHVAAPQQ